MQTRANQRTQNVIMLTGLLASLLASRREDIHTQVSTAFTAETLLSVISTMQAAPFWPIWLGGMIILVLLLARY